MYFPVKRKKPANNYLRETHMFLRARHLAAGLILSACIAALTACGGDDTAPKSVTIPNVVSDTVAAATSALQAAGLALGAQSTASSATVPNGKIITQNPGAGNTVPGGSSVAVVVSSGPPKVSVPSVLSDTIAAAASALQAAGLTLGAQTTVSSASVPSGEIVSQTPAAGASVASGTAVAVQVSSGPSTVTVPNLESDTVAQATSALQAAGLILGSQSTASSSTVPAGEIISQTPTAGTKAIAGSAVAIVVSASAPSSEIVLHSFGSGTDGQNPYGTLIQGSDGDLYGTTLYGGANAPGYGTVFKITPAGVETVLYSFDAGTDGFGDGYDPAAGLVQGTDGNFYGTTTKGGANGAGTVFRITPAGVESVLYSFKGVDGDGSTPYASLIQGGDGNFYGTTMAGGVYSNGTVFKVTPTGAETVLYSFGADPDGQQPYAPLVQGSDGNFYGVTLLGGSGQGTVFKITPAGVETVLYAFHGPGDGQSGYAGLVQGSDGNFYGVTALGGTNGRGMMFKVTPAGVETVLHSFGGTSDGWNPSSALVQGSDGNFYGTSEYGGTNSYGTAFKITPEGAETVLHAFGANGDGTGSYGGPVLAGDGNLYGTTLGGGANGGGGTVYKIVP